MDHVRKLPGLLMLFAVCLLGCSRLAPTEGPKADEPANAKGGIRVSRPETDASEPAIAATDEGKFFIGYVEKDGDGNGDLYVRSFDPPNTLGEPVRVNPQPGQVRTWYGDPPTIAAAADGTVYVGWTARYPDSAKGTQLFVSASRDGGATFGEPVRVHSDVAPASHGMHSLAVAPDGRLIEAWLDERYLNAGSSHAAMARAPFLAFFHHTPTPKPESEPNAELYFSVSSDGGKTFTADQKIGRDICPCCKTSIAIGGDGTVYVAYRRVYEGSRRHISVSVSKDWKTFSNPVQVSDDRWKLDACPVSGPALSIDGGRLAVAWYSGGDAREHGMFLTNAADADARTFDAPKLLDGFEGGGTPAWAGGRLFWINDGNVRTSVAAAPAATLGEGRNLAAAANERAAVYTFVSVAESKKSVWVAVQ